MISKLAHADTRDPGIPTETREGLTVTAASRDLIGECRRKAAEGVSAVDRRPRESGQV
jgi:hypothetical protein